MKTFSNISFLLFVAALLLTTTPSVAQNRRNQNAQEQEVITTPAKYIWGYGDGSDIQSATQNAMQSLLLSISADVSSETQSRTVVVQDGKDVSESSVTNDELRMRAAGKLKDVKTITVTPLNAGTTRILAYITRDQLNEVYNSRLERAVMLCNEAKRAESRGQIDDALKTYYWAMCLLKSTDKATTFTHDGNMLSLWIPQQIRDILRNLKTEVAEVDGRNIKLFTKYKDEPVSSVDFAFNDGVSFSDIQHSAKDGMSEIIVRQSFADNAAATNLTVRYEYAYRHETLNDPELGYIVEYFGQAVFPDAQVVVSLGTKKQQKAVLAELEASAAEQAAPTNTFMQRKDDKKYTKIVQTIAEAIQKNDYESVRQYFTRGGYLMFDTLLHYGEAKILTLPELHCYAYLDKIVCRSIPMTFTYKGNRRVFTEDVTFTFDKNDSIECVAFGLDKPTRDEIYEKQEAWGDTTCTLLATFLENYKTAFALKRLDYIRSIFADEAVILVGHIVKPASVSRYNSEGRLITIKGADRSKTESLTLNKEQYIERLAACFKRNEFINIHFSDCIIDKAYDSRYAINIHQDYYSSTYSDTGFLFLFVNMINPEEPLIQYRAWQAERDNSFNSKVAADNPQRGLITIGDLR